MLSSLRILHAPSSDNPTNLPVVVLSIDAKRFIFNAPEGLTRVLIQRGSRGAVKGLQGVFVPRVGSEECGGLPGLLMSLADQQKEGLDLYGPPILSQYIATARAYTRRNGFRLEVQECHLQGDAYGQAKEACDSTTNHPTLYKDDDVSIQAVPIFPKHFALPPQTASDKRIAKKQKSSISGESGQNPYAPTDRVRQCLSLMFDGNKDATTASEAGEDDIEVKRADRQPPSNAQEELRNAWQTIGSSLIRLSPPLLPSVTLTDTASGQAPALLFIAQGSTIRGKFDAVKAKALGVPEGKMYSILSSGTDVKISRPVDWPSWDQEKRGRWLNQTRTHNSSKASGSKRATPRTDAFDQVKVEDVTVRSVDVVAPSRAGAAFAQVYLPSTDYLDHFLSTEIQAKLKKVEQLHVVVHAVHPAIMRDSRYQAFIKSHKDAHHFIASRPFVPDRLGYPSAALATLRMSYLDQALFKVPAYACKPVESMNTFDFDAGSVQACPLDVEISLHPRKSPELMKDSSPDFSFEMGSAEAEALASFESTQEGDEVRQALNRERWKRFIQLADQLQEEETKRNSLNMDQDHSAADVRITALGTGSALPSKYRNVSGTLVHIPQQAGYMLFDCGEGTYGQLCRKFGSMVDDVVRDLRMIFISHVHGDHHMGMARLLSERRRLGVKDRPLFVLSNSFVRNYLLELNDIQDLDIQAPERTATATSGVIFLEVSRFDHIRGNVHQTDPPKSWEETEHLAILAHSDALQNSNLPNVRIQSAEVDHRTSHCYGIVVRGQGWSVAYSGDTRPCDNFVRACQNVDILVHEATFEDGEEAQAHKKGHSTVGQAIDVARRAGVRRILLTHFSQRYPKIPRIADAISEEGGAASTLMPSVSIAFDLMTVGPDDFGKTERYREALQVLFDDDGDGGDNDSGDGGAGEFGQAGELHTSTKKTAKATPPASTVNGERRSKTVSAIDRPAIQKQLVKEQDLMYVAAHLQPATSRHRVSASSGSGEGVIPTRLAFSEGLQHAVEELHGLVGSSFHRDVLLYEPVTLPDRPTFVQVVVKVASAHARQLVSALSTGVSLYVDDRTFVSQYVGLLNAHELSSLHTLYATTSSRSSSLSAAPGRAWMEQNVRHSAM